MCGDETASGEEERDVDLEEEKSGDLSGSEGPEGGEVREVEDGSTAGAAEGGGMAEGTLEGEERDLAGVGCIWTMSTSQRTQSWVAVRWGTS